jgi:hypothetical protein
MSLKTGNSRRVAKSRTVCMGLNECSEYMLPHLNIHNLSTRSHASEEENRSKNCSVNEPY